MKLRNTVIQLVKGNDNVELSKKNNSNTVAKFKKFSIKGNSAKSVKGGLVVTDVLSF